jgi:hypothetical protein
MNVKLTYWTDSRLQEGQNNALMESGVHGTNGLDPKTSYQIYNTYVLPRLLHIYGLEVLPLKTTTHINKLEDFHRKTI